MSDLTVKRGVTAKKKPRGKPFTGKNDPRNGKGAPKRGQSIKEIAKKIGDLTPKEAADYCKAIAGQLASIGDGVTLKEAVVLRIYTALLFEPDARLFSAIMDRDEGKVSQPVEIYDWRSELEKRGISAGEAFDQLVGSLTANIVRSNAVRGDTRSASTGGDQAADSA